MSVPETQRTKGKLEVITKALELATHTIQITANENVFKPEYRHAITDKIITVATDIYVDCWTANNIKVVSQTEWQARKQLQNTAARNCNVLLALMQIAQKLFHLDTKKVRYWGKLALETRNLIRAWREADQKRYGKI